MQNFRGTAWGSSGTLKDRCNHHVCSNVKTAWRPMMLLSVLTSATTLF